LLSEDNWGQFGAQREGRGESRRNAQKSSKFYAHYLNLLSSNVNSHFPLPGKGKREIPQSCKVSKLACVEWWGVQGFPGFSSTKSGSRWRDSCIVAATFLATFFPSSQQRRSKQVHENKTNLLRAQEKRKGKRAEQGIYGRVDGIFHRS